MDVSSWNDATFVKREATMAYRNRIKMINSNDENFATTRMSRMPCFLATCLIYFSEHHVNCVYISNHSRGLPRDHKLYRTHIYV